MKFVVFALVSALSFGVLANNPFEGGTETRPNWGGHQHNPKVSGDDIARGIIGGIIGVIADELDRQDHRRGRWSDVVCFAENKRGMQFRARGYRARQVQQQAVNRCYNAGSRYCYALGCERTRWSN